MNHTGRPGIPDGWCFRAFDSGSGSTNNEVATEDGMRRLMRVALVTALAAGLVAPAMATDEVFNGSLVCAKCTLKKADAHECQDVLIVTSTQGSKTEYYITKNEVAEKAGEACTQEIRATVTGTVSQKDGKTWLTPSKIEKH
jgi:hypothetical protein